MIYSVRQQKEIPVSVTKKTTYIQDYGNMTRYTVQDASERKIPIGYVDLRDTKNGVEVLYIKNQNPDLYKHFGTIADQLEVEHCLHRGIKNPYIQSVALFGTHIQHFKRGKIFINEGINVLLSHIMSTLKKGEQIYTGFLGNQKMYMPQNSVHKYIDIIKKHPLIK